MAIYILHIQDNNGFTTKKEVESENSSEAVNNELDGKWVKMSNNEIPRGIYGVGTYSYKNGYVLVKKPSGVCDWFRRIHG